MIATDKTPLDWLHWMIGMYSFRAFAGEKPTWMLSYSWDGEQGVSPGEEMQNLFASQLAAGTNCWDARGHGMSGSNDMAMRTEIFGWIAQHEQVFYNSRTPIHPIGVYFSPRTRDYFCDEFIDSYLGLMSLLMNSHQEFEIVTPRTLEGFSRRGAGPARRALFGRGGTCRARKLCQVRRKTDCHRQVRRQRRHGQSARVKSLASIPWHPQPGAEIDGLCQA